MKAPEEDQILEAAISTVVNGRCRRAHLHDLRGGLQAISGAFELLARLARTGRSDTALVDRASAIARSALANHEGAIAEMLEQVIPVEEPAGTVDFGEMIDETLQFLRNDIACKQVRLRVDCCDELEVLAQRHELRLMLLGLLTLHLDACTADAELTVRLERAESLAVFTVTPIEGPDPSYAPQSQGPLYPERVVLEWVSRWLSRHGGRMELMRSERSARSGCRVYYPLHVVTPQVPATV